MNYKYENSTDEELELDIEDCKYIMYKVIKQATEDYVYFYFPANRKQEREFLSAEAFLFNDDHYIDWGGKEYNLNDFLVILNDSKCREPINVNLLREQIRRQAYERNFEEKKVKKNAQYTLDFNGLEKRYKNDEE